STIAALRGVLEEHRGAGRTIGFVPTMGFLHPGHASLMDAARAENDVVVTSIFVNPLQFGPSEDLDSYPRDLTGDAALAEEAGVDLLFVPSATEMYPDEVRTTVHVSGVSEPLEGRTRPTHFDGVATVVTKLFAIVGPCRAYFGEKDFQQLAVVRQMVRDLSLPVEVVGCATIRDADGLALSSRNAYLTPEERAAAPAVHAALQAGRRAIEGGATSPDEVQRAIAAVIEAEPLGELDYAAVVDAASFEVPDPLRGSLRLLVAARFGKARLIDNLGVEVGPALASREAQGP
ncbi:MAG TPA: pantoate--beta-alanine ligase, partial [Acidimicrobiales bacterium]|nr:pantoate--beta-alanine ligase [Acidimicrobiales bacterium]